MGLRVPRHREFKSGADGVWQGPIRFVVTIVRRANKVVTLCRSKRIVVCLSLVLLATSCAPAATPMATPTTAPLATTETTTPPTTETITPSTPPSAEELAKQGFALPEIPRITCEELKQMMHGGGDFVLVDTRSVEWGYNTGHLPGAISIPNQPEAPYTEEWVTMQLEGLPRDKLIIFYCD